ncbi:hypothetical protein ACXO20_07825 [Lactobacillus delbrueckii subsp. bulgaricus]
MLNQLQIKRYSHRLQVDLELCRKSARNFIANFPGFYNSSHTADRFSASRISFMHDFPEMRGSQL